MNDQKQSNTPLRISSLAELKRCVQPGMELEVSYHSKHPALVGLRRVVTKVQSNAYYTVVKDQPGHPYSLDNDGHGFRSDIEKASCYRFDGTKITVLDPMKKDGTVLYEMEVYMGEQKLEAATPRYRVMVGADNDDYIYADDLPYEEAVRTKAELRLNASAYAYIRECPCEQMRSEAQEQTDEFQQEQAEEMLLQM